MANLFELSRRRKHAKDWADQFREGASPEELEYFNRFYQEPSSSPVLQQGALEGELERSKGLYQQAHPSEGVAASSPLSYQRYTEDFAPYTQTNDQGVETAMTGDPMSEQDFLNKQIARQRLAGDTSAAADARYKSETVDDRIAMIEAQAENMPAELQAKGASAEVTTAYMQELGRQIQITRENAPNTPAYQNAVTAVENLHKLYKGTSGGGGFSSYSAQGFIDAELEQGITQSQQSGAIVGEEGGQQLEAPRQTYVEGEYRK